MLKKYLLPLVLTCCIYFNGFAQSPIQSRQYPQNFFRYPLDLPPSTAGSFGELRGAHFHSGLDFKTNQVTGYPVHAAYDGYVSRLRVQFGGFGHAIYITHPNGFTTVYGHVKTFSPAMEKLIKAEQYKQQSFEVDFKLDPLQLEVCQGDVIALSGNEGASAGPHLHFEIRDTQTEETINPQLFGLTIPDKVPPSITAIAIYHLDGSPFSEKTQRQFFAVKGRSGTYNLVKPQVINLTGQIGFGLAATDMTSVSPNHNGIYSCELKLDGRTVYTFAVERFAFDQTHAINAYIDYPELMRTHRWMQKCFILPGSKISLYPQSENRGLINFNDGRLHDVQYVVKDVAGNTSTLNLKIKAGLAQNNLPVVKAGGDLFHYDQRNEFGNDKVRVIIPPGNLYDDMLFTYKMLPKRPGAYSATHSIHNKYTPVHDSYELWIKPDSSIGKYADKAVLVSTDGAMAGGTYQDGFIKGNPHTFGDFFIKVDTVPPVVVPVNIKAGANLKAAKGIYFRIGDNLSGIKSYTGKIDGQWVLMEWDFKSKVLGFRFNDDIAPGKHIFELTVTDNKNNSKYFTASFTR
ncbi:M23 family metallopeptidase [Mucilaginibacter sp. L3T2-6]|uniref:M23 family metallopeptidase n=1 Tax=Mucilaginibacter sp. L3T2-6 TaxID=3062491 RepID=UPI002675C757|nr:M23 family metallopeptidase [Mucilaginibacter sp. L3T2-6]MDO3644669.1 M23 family metallopeptidase [Mucilaginibacter sp. L3T2-6]MDV6217121.1 M23 family metallopeptidase [Mucilaginibacter sp. L3T2-6]